MLQLRWTEQAVTQLEHIVDYITTTSPVYAEGVVLRIDQRLQAARVHPEIGKRGPRYCSGQSSAVGSSFCSRRNGRVQP
ncbi:MAG: type II toxin-antitoxin system RelE/ParE family toxin [Gemmatimonadaceae bacterium]|nr:type II toxin-antitoxin system RelE/ParE family toxin [Gemmatimonadaceae bacterium]